MDRTDDTFRSGASVSAALAGIAGLAYSVAFVVLRNDLDATSPLILVPAALTGFVVNPAWYLWLALIFRRAEPA